MKESFTVLVLFSLVTAGCLFLMTRLIGTDTTPLTLTLVLSTVFLGGLSSLLTYFTYLARVAPVHE